MKIGKLSENALKRSVLKPIKTEFKERVSAAVGTDCAFSDSENAFSVTHSFTLDVEDAGFYAVIKAVNGLVSQGLKPDHVVVAIILDPDTEEKKLKQIIKDSIEACKVCDVIYAGGHTEVSAAVKSPVITVTAVGTKEDKHLAGKNKALKAGLSLVVTNWVGLEGTAIIAKAGKKELTSKYPASFIDDAIDFKSYAFVAKEAAVAIKSGAIAVHDLSNGGIFAGLWEMAERAGTGLNVDLKHIPVRQETIEICEFYEINPYRLLSGGALLIATTDGESMVAALNEVGCAAFVIGTLESGNDRIIVNADESRFLELPQPDEIHKVVC
ncbi:hydrogenase maturation factor [Butyrivibrio sp. X503]|uniref:AIR synthase-related protein n=1 Tax=Butyrivibrio sp. X503 TaxID=2364878 RepID=UPI000EA9C942|nr:AIR synthase-related protein [Butyrivibrio sp. X503]RKM54851.1 hydrogenase maturation factor [Butyrivibrio sp. X503]